MKTTPDKYQKAARLFKALGNPTRLRILNVLTAHCSHDAAGCCVVDIHKKLKLPQPYVSKHLKVLSENGILKYRRAGNKIIYSFSAPEALSLLEEYIKQYKGCC